MNKQFIVIRNGNFNQSPWSVTHATEALAIAEAHRLAGTNPGNKFVVFELMPVGQAQIHSVEWIPLRPTE